ncbi:MAG: glycoside hydrolase family 3 C-terminal domain-containing protein [Victivallaceae bacterium]|nr:glycoside hydrolase family 3 C-terminal domain-containing protein [Victivallaceae bacterium]
MPYDETFLRDLLARLSLDEKISLCYGDGKTGTHPVERLNVGVVTMNDGPRGIRLEDGRFSTALPCGISLACSFSREAAREYGEILAEETRDAGYQAILGPGLNLMRTPLCGRNFEYSGEDPVLAGEIGAAYVEGCQSRGIAACPKHFALNNQETCRRISSSNIDERTLRELYLRAFEIVVAEAKPWLLMSSYNRVNQIYASENRHLQQEILKDEWGFDGVVVSDWGAVHGAYRAATGGLDLEMAGGEGAFFNKPLRALVEKGLIDEKTIDDKALRLLRLAARTGKLGDTPPEKGGVISTPEHRAAAKRLAQEGSVLLKNDGVLPLDRKKIRKIAVVGPSADFCHDIGSFYTCGGSGAVHPEYEITPLAGLKEYLGDGVEVIHCPGEKFTMARVIPGEFLRTPDGKRGLAAEYFASHDDLNDPAAKPIWTNVDEKIDFLWGNMSAWVAIETEISPVDKVAFGVRWKGFFIPEKDGENLFSIYQGGAGHAQLFLDGKLLIDNRSPDFQNGKSVYRFEGKKGEAIPIEIVVKRMWATSQLTFRLLYLRSEPLDEDAIRSADAVLYFGGTNHSYDKEAIGVTELSAMADIPDLELPGAQNELIRRLAELNPKTIVTLIGGSVMDVEPWIGNVGALLDVWYPGQESGRAIAEMLFGEASPRGRLACTWAKKLGDYACHALDLVPGSTDPYCAATDYLEGVFIGYRHFDRAGIEPRFPFGFGLSYTSFDCRVKSVGCTPDRRVEAVVEVINTGRREGSCVIQLYVRSAASAAERPEQELGAFEKLSLAPGERKCCTLSLSERDFSCFSEKANRFVFEPGRFELRFGTSSRDIFSVREIEVR